MNFVSLAMLLAAAGSVATMAHAQRPVPPVPPARPAPAPRAPIAPSVYIDMDAMRDVERSAQDMARAMAPMRDDVLRMSEQARDMALDFARDNADTFRQSGLAAAEIARSMTSIYVGNGIDARTPPAPWAQGDPADSLYRVARDAFNRGEYGRAAQLFEDIRSRYPKSAYVSDAQYFEAYSRYKIGTTDELHTAAKLLEPVASKVINVASAPAPTRNGFAVYSMTRRGASDNEVATLYLRINGVLAQRGDKSAADKITQLTSKTGGSFCDNEDVQVKVEAMNALSQRDPGSALPLLKRVLDRKDDCSAELRRRAVFMLGRRNDAESAQLLVATAKSDPSFVVRVEAITALPRLSGDVGLNALEELLRTEQDERIQRAAVRALTSSDNAKARSSMRSLIDRKDAPLSLRVEAINAFNSERATADDAAYLRNLYGKTDELRVKEAIIGALSRMSGPENDKWVLSIAQNANEPSQLRGAAISRLVRSNVSIADLGKLYDSADNYNMRSQIVSVLGSRTEPEATDKLIDIIRNSTVSSIRTQALSALTRKNDPRSVELLNNILDGKRP